jgi:aerobic carbon-monoxide dehydrogenase medium subunit
MKSASFEYVRPRSLAEASVALGRKGITTAAIAGGQSLLPMLNLRVATIDLLVDISRLADLKAVTKTPTGIWIGALTTHAAIEDGTVPDMFGGLMQRVASQIAYRAVRNHGTIGGSVALADPAGDWTCCLIALGADVRVVGRGGMRFQPVAEFVRSPFETTLTLGELIVGFDIPGPQQPFRWGFAKVARKSGAFAESIAIAVAHGRNGPVAVALGAAGPRAALLANVSKQVQAETPEAALRVAIETDLDLHAPDADAYQKRMHTATILRAVRDMRAQ